MPETPQLHVHCGAAIGALRLHATFTTERPWTVLFGPSGSGKSSLLRLIAGLWQPQESSVAVDGEDVTHLPPQRRRIALVAQQPALFPNMSVRQNIAFGCGSRANGASTLPAMLELFHLETLADAKPASLSGGERQRAAIARAIASTPRVLLLDEVFTGMHREQRDRLMQNLRSYCAQYRIAVLSVTHDVPEALDADEAIRIESGRTLVQGPPHEVLSEEKKQMLASLSQR